MHVGPADASPGQCVAFHEPERLGVGGRSRHRQRLELRQKSHALAQVAAGDLTDDEGMAEHLPARQQTPEFGVGPAQVVNPDR